MPRYLVFTGDGDALGERELDRDDIAIGDTIPAGPRELFRVLDVLGPGELATRAGLQAFAGELPALVVERILV